MSSQIVGSYELINEIGNGTFGRVYLAYHRILGRKVAIKVLKPIGDEKELARRLELFIREAKILSELEDDKIVKIYDAFWDDIGPCIALEYVEGENLRDYIKMCDLSISEIASLFGQIVLGLKSMHGKNIIHRDLKPENILIKYDGIQAKITDFGIAFSSEQDELKTRGVDITGTIPYMSPEQLRGDVVDNKTDL